ncbi:MAG: T9SS type A sorting domain-containing protein, partial [Cyclonatronaceae bacterium]
YIDVPVNTAPAGELHVESGILDLYAASSNAGTFLLYEEALPIFRLGLLNTGTIKGAGTLRGNIGNSGTIRPGFDLDSAGAMVIEGVLTMSDSSVVDIEIGGTAPGIGYDQLRVQKVALNGSLQLSLAGGYTPGPEDLYRIIEWPVDQQSGSFAKVAGVNEFDLAVLFTPTSVVVYDGSLPEPPDRPTLSVTVNAPAFQRSGRSIRINATISTEGGDGITGVRLEEFSNALPQLVSNCPIEDAYENLRCRLERFGVTPPEPEGDEEPYPFLAEVAFPGFPEKDGGDVGSVVGDGTLLTGVFTDGSSLTLEGTRSCELEPARPVVAAGRPVVDYDLSMCAYELVKLSLDVVPGYDCFKLATSIGTHIGEGFYNGQFDLTAYLAANALGAIQCAGDAVPHTKAIKIMKRLNEYASAADGIASAATACGFASNVQTITAYAKGRTTTCIASYDPNDKFGPEGVLDDRFIAEGDSMGFTIFFENKEEATAPAQVVIISDTLDTEYLDLSTFSFGMVAWTDTSAVLAPDSVEAFRASADVDLRPAMNLIVRVNAELDETTGIIRWVFDSLDPETLEPTPDPLAGFLPPNNENFAGEGLVSYSVSLKPDVPSGSRFGSAARIFFDENEPIDTPVWSNILDTEAPVSAVSPLDSVQTSADFTVSWSGQDDASGIRFYTIYVSENGAEPEVWLSETESTSMTYAGSDGSTYAFFSSAADHVGNRSVRGSGAEAVTTVQVPTSIEHTDMPAEFILSQNYPNPFNPGTIIRFGLPEAAEVRLEVYDLAGRRVAVLIDGNRAAGWHTVNFDGSTLSSGVYMYRLSTGDFVQTRKLLLLK